ncbi:MAG TPA: radical SAM protein [Phycisphaerales bacterium]|jgi:cyclic dehypoxanthinyl futalosine synthase|nr:radical SAM protein [Phycisphaerales bacterium]|tara:strand:- start:2387 stop:3748 length:1362 start_codon:yes stop_codon:yes gene_type:complete
MHTVSKPHANILDTAVLQDVTDGNLRITPEQALRLYHEMPLPELGRWADARCRTLHGDHLRTYVIDRNINYTNVCTAKCTFCAFRRDGHEDDAYTLSYDALKQKVKEIVEIGGTQILMQGGMNPELPLSWYVELLEQLRSEFPTVHIHAFSPPEIIEFINFFNTPGSDLEEQIRFVLTELQNAGLQSIPGGGGEIFAPAVREKIGLGKCTAEVWLLVMRVAHELGMNTSATMMFGHLEGIADRIHHMDLVRSWQDQSIQDFGLDGGGRYVSFIAWPFQPDNTPLGRIPEMTTNDVFPGDIVAKLDGTGHKSMHKDFGRRLRLAGSSSYLRTQALSRLYLDNIYSIGSSWVTMGPAIGQTALMYGANDLGSVMLEENVVSAAGTTWCLDEAKLCRMIREAGFTPAKRDNTYNLLTIHTGDDAPDRRIKDWSVLNKNKLVVHTEDCNNVPLTLSK